MKVAITIVGCECFRAHVATVYADPSAAATAARAKSWTRTSVLGWPKSLYLTPPHSLSWRVGSGVHSRVSCLCFILFTSLQKMATLKVHIDTQTLLEILRNNLVSAEAYFYFCVPLRAFFSLPGR